MKVSFNQSFNMNVVSIYWDLAFMYTNENWFVILLSQVYFGDLVTEIRYLSPLNDNISAQLRTRREVESNPGLSKTN